MSFQQLYASDEAQSAQTPKAMFAALDQVYFRGKRYFDVCPVKPTFDGLAIKWHPLNYCNPPFRNLTAWAEKAATEAKSGHMTVLLMPARLNTKYFFNLLENARSIAIWFNPVTFLPFKSSFPLCIITVQFGGPCLQLAGKTVTGRKVKADAWSFDGTTTVPKLAKRLNESFPNVTQTQFRTVKKVGWSFVNLTCNFAESIGYLIEHCNTYPDAVVVVGTITMFQANYFVPAYNLVQRIIFYSPGLSFDGLKTFASNQLVVLSKRPVTSQAVGRRSLPHVWLLKSTPHALSDT